MIIPFNYLDRYILLDRMVVAAEQGDKELVTSLAKEYYSIKPNYSGPNYLEIIQSMWRVRLCCLEFAQNKSVISNTRDVKKARTLLELLPIPELF